MTTIDPLAAVRVRARTRARVKGGAEHLSRAVLLNAVKHIKNALMLCSIYKYLQFLHL